MATDRRWCTSTLRIEGQAHIGARLVVEEVHRARGSRPRCRHSTCRVQHTIVCVRGDADARCGGG
jgi:hypothetical protein